MCRSFVPSKKRALTSLGGNGVGTRTDPGASFAKHLAQHIALLLDVVRSGRWSSFENIVLTNPSVFRLVCDAVPDHADFEGTTLLHEVLRHDPAPEVVLKMIKMLPDRTAALRATDADGRTPLHVAAACDAHPSVLKLLGSFDPTTCDALDEDGRTPLHLACDISSAVWDENDVPSQTRRRGVSYDAVRALLSESLSPSLVEDEDGMSALEHAIVSDASIEVVNLLQKATVRAQKDQEGRRQASKKRRVNIETDSTGTHTVDSTRIQRRRSSIVSV